MSGNLGLILPLNLECSVIQMSYFGGLKYCPILNLLALKSPLDLIMMAPLVGLTLESSRLWMIYFKRCLGWQVQISAAK